MLFPLNKSKDEVAILLDISSGYVEGAFVEFKEGNMPRVIFSRKIPMPFDESKNIDKFEALMVKALDEALKVLALDGLQRLKTEKLSSHVKNVYCVFSSPWYVSETRIIKIDKEKPITLTQSVFNKLIENQAILFKESVNKGEYAKNFKDTVELLESKVVRVKVNGYETGEPIGKVGKSFELSVYLSIAPVSLLSKVKEAIRKNFHVKTTYFHSAPLTLFAGIRDLSLSSPDFFLLDVREEVTDVSLIKKGLLLETVTLPLGTRFYLREMIKTWDTSPAVALSFFRLFSENKAEPEIASKIQEFIHSKNQWIEYFRNSLKSFSEEFFLPKTVYVATDSDFMLFIATVVRDEVFEQFAGDNDPFTVIPIDPTFFKKFYKAEVANDRSLLAMESVFIKKISV